MSEQEQGLEEEVLLQNMKRHLSRLGARMKGDLKEAAKKPKRAGARSRGVDRMDEVRRELQEQTAGGQEQQS